MVRVPPLNEALKPRAQNGACATEALSAWVIQSAPSGPVVSRSASLLDPETLKTVTTPDVVMRPKPRLLVNHKAPSGPAMIPDGPVTWGYSVMAPAVVIRPILLPLSSVNHKAPSGPATISSAKAPGVGIGYSVTAPLVV